MTPNDANGTRGIFRGFKTMTMTPDVIEKNDGVMTI